MLARILYLDDSAKRQAYAREYLPKARRVKTVKDCLAELKDSEWDVVFLDHDLGGKEYVDSNELDTGAEVARHMTRWPWKWRKPVAVVCHTVNDKGGEYMTEILNEAGFLVIRAQHWSDGFEHLVKIVEQLADLPRPDTRKA